MKTNVAKPSGGNIEAIKLRLTSRSHTKWAAFQKEYERRDIKMTNNS